MHLSRFSFNPARRGAHRLLNSAHVLHAAVLASFPDPSPNEAGRVLWRVDATEHGAVLYVVSPTRPDFTHLAEQAGWPTLPESWSSRPYAPLLEKIADGDRFAFRLTANPVRSTRPAPGERGKPHGHVTVAQQEAWLLARQEHNGFQVSAGADGGHDLVVRDRKTLTFRRRETQVTLRVATFEGTLEVRDRDAFVAALGHGIGRAKGYGCGLLTVAAVRG